MTIIAMVDFKNKLFNFISIFLLICFFSINAKASNLIEKKIIVNASFDNVQSVLSDYESYDEFFYHMIKSKILNTINENKKIAYFEFEILGRNFWAKVELEKIIIDNEKIIIKERTLETNLKQLHGSFIVEKLDSNKTQIIFTGTAKPYLPLPDSFIKKLIDKELSAALKKINHRLQKR